MQQLRFVPMLPRDATFAHQRLCAWERSTLIDIATQLNPRTALGKVRLAYVLRLGKRKVGMLWATKHPDSIEVERILLEKRYRGRGYFLQALAYLKTHYTDYELCVKIYASDAEASAIYAEIKAQEDLPFREIYLDK
jgi:hypothetical protein